MPLAIQYCAAGPNPEHPLRQASKVVKSQVLNGNVDFVSRNSTAGKYVRK
jgi:hypothetical protein